MYTCDQCQRSFKTRTKLKYHKKRKTVCRLPTHYCSMCREGLTSKRTLLAHKRLCKKRPEVNIAMEKQVQLLKVKINDFLERLDGDFQHKLNGLEAIFSNTVNNVPQQDIDVE